MLVDLLQDMLAVLLELRMLNTLCLLGHTRLRKSACIGSFPACTTPRQGKSRGAFVGMFDWYVDVDTA